MLAEGIRLVFASGECEIDLARRELRVLGSPVPVGVRAFEIVEVLAQSAGELVTKDELMDRIWPGAVVMENTLQVHVAAVRKALGPYRRLLKTELRRGYRLLGEWTVRSNDPPKPPVGLRPIRVPAESPVTNFPATVTRLYRPIGGRAEVAGSRFCLPHRDPDGPGRHWKDRACIGGRPSWPRRVCRRRVACRTGVAIEPGPGAVRGGRGAWAEAWLQHHLSRSCRSGHRWKKASAGSRQLRTRHRRGGGAGGSVLAAMSGRHDPGNQSRSLADRGRVRLSRPAP